MNNKKTNATNLKTCRYCRKGYAKKDGEHVFPFGLGGENLHMDCVCGQCNNYFSGLELELYQKSFIGLLRSTEGVEGYNPNTITPAPFKAPILLSFDEENKIVFEVGQYFQMKVFVRPQIIRVQGKFYLQANTAENAKLFSDEFVKWKRGVGILTAWVNKEIIPIKFILAEGYYTRQHEPTKNQIKKAIQYCSLPDDHHLYPHLGPRIFMDDDGELKLRAKTVADAEAFLEDFLNDSLDNKLYSSFSGLNLDSPLVDVGFSFDGLKLEQALVKIGLNCLIYYFPQFKEHPSLDPYIDYILRGTHGIRGGMEAKDQLMDSVPKTHNIFFSFWGGNVRVRISLFDGQFVFGFWIDNLPFSGPFSHNRLLIDYGNRKHKFQDTIAFLKSFPTGSKASGNGEKEWIDEGADGR
ncbi:MAG: hypothetical protein JWP45_641 [Mucilaginibacter sp.]|nr:hypothetical protein [Mucilaginibacter sp.]